MALAVALLMLVAGRIFWRNITGMLSAPIFRSGDSVTLQAYADSLVVLTADDFQLSDSVTVDSQLIQPGGHTFRQLSLRWPKAVPFEFFARRLRQRSTEENLSCDCIESAGSQRMTCELTHNGLIGTRVIVEADAGTKLLGREFALLVKNIGAWKNDDIVELIDKGVKFTYIGSPDTYPAARVKRKLESAGVETILELPGKNLGLIETKSKSRGSSSGKGGTYRNLMNDLYGRHPGPRAIYFDKTDGYDPEFVKEAIAIAEEEDIAFLYEKTEPDEIDSLAYSGGLVILSAKNIADIGENSQDGLEAKILNRMIMPDSQGSGALVCDARLISPSLIVDIFQSLSKLGVNIKNYIDLADTVKSF